MTIGRFWSRGSLRSLNSAFTLSSTSDSHTENDRAPAMCPSSYTDERRASRTSAPALCSAATSSPPISTYGLSGCGTKRAPGSGAGAGDGGGGAGVGVGVGVGDRRSRLSSGFTGATVVVTGAGTGGIACPPLVVVVIVAGGTTGIGVGSTGCVTRGG